MATDVWIPAALVGIEVKQRRYPGNEAVVRSVCDTYAVGWVEGGELVWLVDGLRHEVAPDVACVLNPGVVIGGARLSGAPRATIIGVAPALVEEAAGRLARRARVHGLRFRHFAAIGTGLLSRARVLAAAVRAGDEEEQEEALTRFLPALVRQEHALDGRRRERTPIGRVKAYLEDHLADTVALAELAKVACLSRYHLVRQFKGVVGVPPHTYQRLLRVARAGTLVRRGVALAEVASAVGFADQSHLTRTFHRVTGITPGAYARRAGVS